ncbi:MAG: iron-sulfur cluster assembly scaffold protein [Acidobacteria bacterium]|nr:iron-sulfur cluster assembly scaffold protein [Acidobacteriota bacterium]
MYTAQVLDHFQNPRHVGELPPPAITVEVTNPACGDILRLSAVMEQGSFQQVRFKARGCVAAIACGSLLSELLQSSTVERAAQISASQIAQKLGGLPPESGHAAELAADALHSLLKEIRRQP